MISITTTAMELSQPTHSMKLQAIQTKVASAGLTLTAMATLIFSGRIMDPIKSGETMEEFSSQQENLQLPQESI